MTFQLIYTEQYEKRAERFLKRHPELENQRLKTLQLLEMNPPHPSLHLPPWAEGYREGTLSFHRPPHY